MKVSTSHLSLKRESLPRWLKWPGSRAVISTGVAIGGATLALALLIGVASVSLHSIVSALAPPGAVPDLTALVEGVHRAMASVLPEAGLQSAVCGSNSAQPLAALPMKLPESFCSTSEFGLSNFRMVLSESLPETTPPARLVIAFNGAFFLEVAGLFGVICFGFMQGLLAFYTRRLDRQKSLELDAAIGQITEQVAHDIRSPLTALENATKDMAMLPEDNRVMIRSAVERIRDTANSLTVPIIDEINPSAYRMSRNHSSNGKEGTGVYLISSLIDVLVSEKRIQFRTRPEIQIESQIDQSSYGLFANIDPKKFGRMFSNLVNNAVEAIEKSGSVKITLNPTPGNELLLVIEDNGKGISEKILPKLGTRGFSHGKIGSGLGIFGAREIVESWSGKLDIESTVGVGTRILIRLPRADSPPWFVPQIILRPETTVVVLDDDNSIHHLWDSRLREAKGGEQIQITHFSSGREFSKWFEDQARESAGPKSCLYLFDYELLGEEGTGLDWIRRSGITEQAILVTSRYDETSVRSQCAELKIRMIPKGLAGWVPLVVEAGASPVHYYAVLIDDQKSIQLMWKIGADQSGKKILIFPNVSSFLEKAAEINTGTTIYIDSDLGGKVRGEVEAKKIHDLGFLDIYLTTGHSADQFDLEEYPWIRSVRGKTVPWQD